MNDHSVLEALAASLDEREEGQSHAAASASDGKDFSEAQHFSAVYKGKAKRIAQITDTRMHQRAEQALVQWTDGTTAWIGIQDLSSAAQEHVRNRMHGSLDSDDEKDKREQQQDDSEDDGESKRTSRKRRRKIGQSTKYNKRNERREKRQKKKQEKELDAKISTSYVLCLATFNLQARCWVTQMMLRG